MTGFHRAIHAAVLMGAILIGFVAAATTAFGQGTLADYERAKNLGSLTGGKVFTAKIDPHWFAENTRFWYRNDRPGGTREFILVETETKMRRPAFDHARLAESLAKATGKPCEATHLPIDAIECDVAENAIRFQAHGKRWKCGLDDYAIAEDAAEKPAEEPAKKPDDKPSEKPTDKPTPDEKHKEAHQQPSSPETGTKSPDGKWFSFAKNRNLYLREEASGKEFQLTSDGTEQDGYKGRVSWSPDSKKLVAMRETKGEQRIVYLIESSPKDQLQPKLHEMTYAKPGDKLRVRKPHLFDVDTQREIPVCDELFSNPWSIRDGRWCPDSRRYTFHYNQRGHQVLRIIAIDGTTGEVGTIIDEQSKTFIDYAGKCFDRLLGETNEIIWMSERDGWNHLYLYDSRTGQVKNQITKGHWVVRRVDRVDEENRQIWFQAGGIYPEQDPYYVHYCRIDFDGTNLLVLTDGNGTHSIAYSPDRQFILDTYSRVDMAPVTELRRVADGTLVCELERADLTELIKTGWQMPERFVAKGRDCKTDIYGVIYRPTTFDPKKKYPVLEAIYAGPHGSFVPKSFRSNHGAQGMAELGFILVQIDGMGTSNRSKAFHDVCWKNLGDSGFPDRILWMKAAAKKYPFMDLSRVGIYGGSAGGQSSTRAMLAFGDFYKVAVSDCGCHDNRMDKIWWNELWMGWPIGPHYEEQSNVTQAHNLKGKLLLIVGELDRNVDPASTMQVVNALIKADKDFDMLVVPGSGHGLGGAYGFRRRQDYFVRHLLGVEPRNEP